MTPTGRLCIHNALTGDTLRFTDAATRRNGWSIPAGPFDVKDLLGEQVGIINSNNSEKEEKLLVTAVLTPEGEVAPASFPLFRVAVNDIVKVVTGEKVLPFKPLKFTDEKVADLSGVNTPRTPSPCSDRGE